MHQPHPFVDYVKIYFRSGAGGPGKSSFRRESKVALGGPDGGDGGDGGDIVLRGNAQLWTLLDLKYRKFIHAADGLAGEGSRRSGKKGKDEVLDVPLGTVVKDAESGKILGEITDNGQEMILLRGGRGGKGNWFFRTATNQAPEHSQSGIPSQEMTAILELKVLADVGLVGFPNAGKSTLLSVLSEARPKIADYPFTTLVPNLGLVRYRDHRSFVMADIPGIIEGASEGKGLGTQFLRHIERNSVLLFMVPADADDIGKEYQILMRELELYNADLLQKERLLAITKCDLIDEELVREIAASLPGLSPVFISAAAQQGLELLLDRIWDALQREQKS